MRSLVFFSHRLAAFARVFVPDPFVIAILLSLLVLALGSVFGKASLFKLFDIYAAGMMSKGLLTFAFQMALILSTGYALAEAKGVRRWLHKLADIPGSQRSAVWMVAMVSMLLALLNWGLGLVAGAFLAREVGRSLYRRGLPLNYGLLGAAGYTGLLVWHGGLSGSAPLKVAGGGFLGKALPVSETLFSPLNIAVCLTLVVVIPLLLSAMSSESTDFQPLAQLEADEEEETESASGWDNSFLWTLLLLLPLGVALVRLILQKGLAAIGLNSMILLFLFLGLLAHKRPLDYARSFGEGARASAGILLQFPLYFGIMAVARDSGLMLQIAQGFQSLALSLKGTLAPATTATLTTFASASILNLFVPSGGGQWVIQGSVVASLATSLKVAPGRLVMAFSYGDQLTNMLQPFWALPLLSITGLKARELLGYNFLVMLVAGGLMAFWLVLL